MREPKRQDSAERQLQILSELSRLPAQDTTAEQLEPVFEIAAHPASDEAQLRAAVLLAELYPTLAPQDSHFAERTHTILLRDLLQPRKTLAHPSCSWLVLTHLREENLAHIPWQSAREVTNAAECFYVFCDAGMPSDDSHRRVRDLVKYAGLRFAEQGKWEELFCLLACVQVPDDLMDADLFRLRNALVLYEQRRVRRMQRGLVLVSVAAILFLLTLSPVIFMGCENPYRSAHGIKAVGFFDATYWSVITSATVGYGEIVPHTVHGRLLAIFDSLMGMTLLGVVAGMILSYVSPRRLS